MLTHLYQVISEDSSAITVVLHSKGGQLYSDQVTVNATEVHWLLLFGIFMLEVTMWKEHHNLKYQVHLHTPSLTMIFNSMAGFFLHLFHVVL